MWYFKRFDIKFIILLICAGTMLWSCSDDNRGGDVFSQVPASFTSRFDEAPTRVTDTSLSDDDCVGIYMLAKNGVIDNADFAIYTPNGSTLVADGTGLFYPPGQADVSFIAFAPIPESGWGTYTDGANTVTYNLFEQKVSNDLTKVDFVYCDTGDAEYYNSNNKEATLTFKHRLSKVIIRVFPAEGVTHDMDKLKATISGLPTTVDCYLSDGSTKKGSNTDALTLPYIRTDKDGATFWEYAIIVAPHENASRTVAFQFEGASKPFATKTIASDKDKEYESENSYTYSFTLTQTDVVWKSTDVTNWTGGTLTWSGKHVIRCSEPSLALDVYKTSGTMLVSTTYQGTFDNNTSGWLKWNFIPVTNYPNAEAGYKYYELNYTADGNSTTLARNDKITLAADGLALDIPVSQRAGNAMFENVNMKEANCYMTPPERILYIPAGARVKDFNDNYCDGAPYDIYNSEMMADVLWSDVSAYNTPSSVVHPGSAISGVEVLGIGEKSVIKVAVGEKEGNAVIAFRDKSTGIIRWSFHIWVTKYDPTSENMEGGYDYSSGGVRRDIMGRNLGANSKTPERVNSLGLLYQWGRKDPFPGTSGINNDDTILESKIYLKLPGTSTYIETSPFEQYGNEFLNYSEVTISTSLSMPLTFFLWYDEDWCRTDANESELRRWQSKYGKAIDDPCPVGWYVPNLNALLNDASYYKYDGMQWKEDTKYCGWYYDSSPEKWWWPVVPYRESDAGNLKLPPSYRIEPNSLIGDVWVTDISHDYYSPPYTVGLQHVGDNSEYPIRIMMRENWDEQEINCFSQARGVRCVKL